MPRNDLDAILSRDRMEESQLSAKDVCRIVQTAKEMGVVSLEFLSLRVRFGSPKDKQILGHQSPTADKPIPDASNLAALQESNLLDESLRIREEELASLAVTDPDKYEDLIIEGDLENGAEETDDSGS